jgi:MYXO-CTERM domain-containing protein
VTFSSNFGVIGTVPLEPAGVATIQTTTLEVGKHTVSAHFTSSDGYADSDSNTITHRIYQGFVGGQISATPNPSSLGSAVTFTTQLAAPFPYAGAPPTGIVELRFKDGGVTVASGELDDAGTATLVTNALPLGEHMLYAFYLGDSHYHQTGAYAGIVQQVVEGSGSDAGLVDAGETQAPSDASSDADQTIDAASVDASPTTSPPTDAGQTLSDGALAVADAPPSAFSAGGGCDCAVHDATDSTAPIALVPLAVAVTLCVRTRRRR